MAGRGLALETRLAHGADDNRDNRDSDDTDDNEESALHEAVNDAEQDVLTSANACFEVSELAKLLLP
jgi:hypothetical protein